MTLDEFLAWDSSAWGDVRWQLIDGEPVAMAPARFPHGSLQGELARLIGNHLLGQGLSCIVVTQPGVVPKVRADDNSRVPDLGITRASPVDQVMIPEPVLLVEIMSPNNRAATRANVWAYTTIPTVREIVTLQGTRIEAELLRREPDGGSPDQPLGIAKDGVLELRSIGFSVPLAALHRTTYLAP